MKKPLQSFLQTLNLNNVLDGDSAVTIPWSQLNRRSDEEKKETRDKAVETKEEVRYNVAYRDEIDVPAAPSDFYETNADTLAASITTKKYTPPPTPPTPPKVAPPTPPKVAPPTPPKVAPPTPPKVAPEVAPKVAPEVAPKVAPEVAPKVAPEVTESVARSDAKAHFFVEELNEVVGDFIARYEAMEKKQVLAAKHRVIETYEQLLHALTSDYQHALRFGTMRQHEEQLLERSRKLLEYDNVIALIRQL